MKYILSLFKKPHVTKYVKVNGKMEPVCECGNVGWVKNCNRCLPF